jgi:hypothetical protein
MRLKFPFTAVGWYCEIAAGIRGSGGNPRRRRGYLRLTYAASLLCVRIASSSLKGTA